MHFHITLICLWQAPWGKATLTDGAIWQSDDKNLIGKNQLKSIMIFILMKVQKAMTTRDSISWQLFYSPPFENLEQEDLIVAVYYTKYL